ncbi:MAG TPA: S8 family serine peptidase, partial [Thermoplasmata archaeon]|nr:S8 family serine peptidase [Thermoplasmata archaeon]
MRGAAQLLSWLAFVAMASAGLAAAVPGPGSSGDGDEAHYFVPSDVELPSHVGIRTVESYGSFHLVASSVPLVHPRISSYPDYGSVFFSTGPRDPVADPLDIDAARPGSPAFYIVQFRGPIKEEWKSRLSAFGSIAVYVPHDSFVVVLSPGEVAQVSSLPEVRWVGHFDASYKLDPRVSRLAATPLAARDTDRIRVVEFPGADPAAVEAVFDSHGTVPQVTYELLIGRITVLRAPVDLANLLQELASTEGVQWVEPAQDAVARNDLAKWVIQTGQSGQAKLHDKGIKGEGQVAGVADDGQDFTHPAFTDSARPVQEIPDPANPKPPDNAHRKVVNWWDFGGSKSASHGTSTSSIIAGGEATPHQYDGMAPNAKLSMQAISFSNIDPIAKLFTAAYGDGGRTHSDSWGNDNGRYDAWSIGLDDFMWKNDDMQIQIAIANRGPNPNTVSSPESAKNCIATGATNHPRSGAGSEDDVESYSARGPAEDGRLKPDLLAPSRETAADAGTTNYGSAGQGTSFATPSISGGITLLRQYYVDGFYPSGKKNAADSINPSAALLKASAINSGKEMNGQGSHTNPYKSMPYPNVDQGWGRITMDDALYFDGDVRKLVAIEEKTGFKTGDSKEYQIGVEGSAEHFEATLVWTDYPGTAGPTRNLVNDLDLEVTSPSGKAYKGNVFGTATPHQSDEGGTRDDLNNVENVLRIAPETGVWKVKVTANAVPQGTTQKFALVASGELAPPTGVNLISPKGGEILKGNSTTQVQWTSAGAMQANSVDVFYSTDDGATWKPVATGQPLNGSYQWPVPAVDTKLGKVKIAGKDSGGNAKVAESKSFWIDSTPPATKLSAAGAVSLQPDVNLTLTMSDAISGVLDADVQVRVGTG